MRAASEGRGKLGIEEPDGVVRTMDANLRIDVPGKKTRAKKSAGKPPAAEEESIKGRKDNSGQEKVVDYQELGDRIQNLEQLQLKAAAAKEAYAEAVKATAEKSGLMASVVRKFIKARVDDSGKERSREAQQLQGCFKKFGFD